MIQTDCKQKDSRIKPILRMISLSPINVFFFFNCTRVGLIPPNYNYYFEMNDQKLTVNKKTVGLIPSNYNHNLEMLDDDKVE